MGRLHNSLNQLLYEVNEGNETLYYYDVNGNLVNQWEEGIVKQYSYDVYNRLIDTVIIENGAVITTENYQYDHEGNRITKTTGEEIVSYVIDTNRTLAQVEAELDASGKLLSSYHRGLDLISMITQLVCII